MKQYLIYAGIFVASFLVINVGMYFFLDSMQPAPELAGIEGADSTGVIGDSASVIESASVDSSIIATPDSTIEQRTNLADAFSGNATESVDTNVVTGITPSLNEVPPMETSNPDVRPMEIDPAAALASNESDYDTPAIEPEEIPAESLPQPNPKELAKLAKLLEGMKPAEAAAIASRLGTEEIVALVMKMKDRKAAKMMAELPVDRAAQVAERMSELIAQRGTKS